MRYNHEKREFTVIPPYPIVNKDCTTLLIMPIELKDFLMSRAQPVTEDLEIYACYRGVKEDLAKLKEEGWLREFNKDKFKELSERL